jgi:hypothetical protein
MRWVKRQRIRAKRPGIDLDAQLNAVIAVNSGRDGQVTHARSEARASSLENPEEGSPGRPGHAAAEDRPDASRGG